MTMCTSYNHVVHDTNRLVVSSTNWQQLLQSICPATLNRRLTAAELGKVEFALIKASLTAGYELRQSVVVLLLDRYWAS